MAPGSIAKGEYVVFHHVAESFHEGFSRDLRELFAAKVLSNECQCSVSRYVCVHGDSISSEEAGIRRKIKFNKDFLEIKATFEV